MRITRWWAFVLLGIPIACLGAFFIAPFVVVVVSSLQTPKGYWTLENYTRALFDLYYWDAIFLTFRIAFWVTLSAFILGYPLAYVMARVVKNNTIRRLLYIVAVIPLFTSNIVRSFGWMIILGRQGMVNNSLVGLGFVERPIALLYTEFSIIIGLAYIMLPFMILTIASVLQNIDRSLEDAAMDLGASRLKAFFKITLPLSLPGVIAGSLIVFTLSVSAYVTPSVLSGGKKHVMSMLIYQQYDTNLNFNFGATLAVTLLISTLVLIAGYLWALERGPRARSGVPA